MAPDSATAAFAGTAAAAPRAATARQGARFCFLHCQLLPGATFVEGFARSVPAKRGIHMTTSSDPVLIIDDHFDTRSMLVELLELEGFSVLSAGSGREALAVVRDVRPCLVL